MVILQFLVVAATAAIDAVWFKLMNPFYRSHSGELLADKPAPSIQPTVTPWRSTSFTSPELCSLPCGPRSTAAAGWLPWVTARPRGTFAYATYDPTNAATLKLWPPQLIVVDMLWGAVLTGLSTFVGWLDFHART